MDVLDRIWALVLPEQGVALSGRPVLVVLALALVAVALRPSWQVLRLGVTLVHELGHAVVGVLCGRRFTGFVLRGDMSGHAVTTMSTKTRGMRNGAMPRKTTSTGLPVTEAVM